MCCEIYVQQEVIKVIAKKYLRKSCPCMQTLSKGNVKKKSLKSSVTDFKFKQLVGKKKIM